MQETTLPKHVSDRRRISVSRYTLMALLVYHVPVITAYLAKYFHLARYDYSDINYIYVVIILFNIIALAIIQLKKHITKRFLNFSLFFQISLWGIVVTMYFYVMADLRVLTLLASLLAFVYVFTQARLLYSLILIGLITLDYLIVSFIGITLMEQSGSFGREVLKILVFLPVSFFVAYMCNILRKQQIKSDELELRVIERTNELQEKNNRLEIALEDIKTLNRLLPICSQCKKIRDDKGYWNQIESYIEKNSETKFSHSLCPECSDEFYGNEEWYIEMKKNK